MKRQIKMLLVTVLVVPCMLLAIACGGGSGIGSKPKIPAFAQTAPASAAALADSWESNAEFSDVDVSNDSYEIVMAKRTVSSKEYEVAAINYGSEIATTMLNSYKQAWDTARKAGGDAALKKALEEEGITNFNWDSTGMSWTEDGYDCFYKVVGDWMFAQVPYEA